MLAKILGWFWIGMGVLFVLKPDILKRRLQKKSIKKFKKYIFLVSVGLGLLLLKVGFQYTGAIAKVIMVIGIIAVFKGFFLLKVRTSEKLIEWFSNKPLIFYRICSCFHIAIGIMILSGVK